MSDQWYFAQKDQKFGPVSSQKLKALAQSGQLKTVDLIWKEGMENWVQAGRLKGLFFTASNSATGPPPLKANPPAETKPAVAAGTDSANTQQAVESNQSEPSATPRADKCAVICYRFALASAFFPPCAVLAIVFGLSGLKSTKRQLAIRGLFIVFLLFVFTVLILTITIVVSYGFFVLSPINKLLEGM